MIQDFVVPEEVISQVMNSSLCCLALLIVVSKDHLGGWSRGWAYNIVIKINHNLYSNIGKRI